MRRHRLPPALLTIALLCALGGSTAGARDCGDLDPKLQREVIESARAYFDPNAEFFWRPRRALQAAFAKMEEEFLNPLEDVWCLQHIVYQGRGFLPRFDDPKWQKKNRVDVQTFGACRDVKGEAWHFTYAQPPSYPTARELSERIPRIAPLPLLVALHGLEDTRTESGEAQKNPGRIALERLYPRNDTGTLYDRWFLLAPVATRARFLEKDKTVRHQFLTAAITEFWRHYHVDYDRIVIDGGAAAAALAAVFPNMFAGLVLRGGPIEKDLVQNYASVPVYVVGDPDLAKELVDAGHPDVASGDAGQHLLEWLDGCRRSVAVGFSWRMTREDHRYANWITLVSGAEERTLTVGVDPDAEPIRITIDSKGVDRMAMSLNDQILFPLDQPFEVVWNGVTTTYREKPSLAQAFEKDPFIRRNMAFGWLYPVVIQRVGSPNTHVGPSAVETDDPAETTASAAVGAAEDEAKARLWYERGLEAEREGDQVKARTWYRKAADVGRTSYWRRATNRMAALDDPGEEAAPPLEPPLEPPAAAPAPQPYRDDRERLEVQKAFLYGRLDLVGVLLRDATDPVHRLPVLLRDLWWRPVADRWLEADVARLAQQASGLVKEQYEWILGGGVGPYPESEHPHQDPWPVITALVLDRQYREKIGRAFLPQASPLASMTPPGAWADWWPEWVSWFLDDTMRVGFEGEDLSDLPDDIRKEAADRDALASTVGALSLWLSILAGVLFVGGVLLAGLLLGRGAEAAD